MKSNSTIGDEKNNRKNEHATISPIHDDRPPTVSLSTSSSASSESSIPYHRHKKHGSKCHCEFKQRNAGNYGSATSTNTAATNATGATNNNIDGHSSILYCLHGKKNVEVRDHCHQQRTEGVDVKARKKLIIASVLCLVFMICEIIGGVASNSLAIATDAAHLLTDFASFMISLFAIWIAGRPSTQRMSFGWYRAEVIGALVSVLMIWVITAILVWLAVGRLINGDFELNAVIMLITSGLAILVNLIMGCQLQHGHTHGGSGGGHGHSHGVPIEKLQSPISLSKTYVLPVSETPKTSKVAATAAATTEPPCSVSNHVCPVSPTERIEDGAADLVAVDAQMPGAGLQRFSYQNSRSISEVNASDVTAAAVMAETAAGAHHHGGMAAKQAVNMNVRAAYIHVIGDMIQSVGVFIAALVIYFKPSWVIIDPICTFFFSIIVLFTTFSILKDALLVLMEGTPSFTNYTEVLAIFQQIEGVERVHNLRIWALSINKIALSVHLAIGPGANPKAILQEANRAVHLRYNFFETTIQIEDFTPQMESCQQCTVPET